MSWTRLSWKTVMEKFLEVTRTALRANADGITERWPKIDSKYRNNQIATY